MSRSARSERSVRVRRALAFLRPYRGPITAVIALSLLVAVLGALEPLILKLIFDALGQPDAIRTLVIGVGGLVAANVAREVIGGIVNWLSWKVRLAVNQALLDATVGRIHSLPIQFHRQEGVGSLMTRLDRGISGFVAALSELFNVVPSVVFLLVSISVMVHVDWRLAFVALVFAPLPAVIGALAAPEPPMHGHLHPLAARGL